MKKKVLIVLGSIGNKYSYEYIINDDDTMTANKIHGKKYVIRRIRKYGDSLFIIPVNIIKSFFQAKKILKISKPYAVISSGPGLTISLFFWSKIFSIKTIYIETWSRVVTKSASGKICYYLSDIFFVQWKDLLKKYPRAVYSGRLG